MGVWDWSFIGARWLTNDHHERHFSQLQICRKIYVRLKTVNIFGPHAPETAKILGAIHVVYLLSPKANVGTISLMKRNEK